MDSVYSPQATTPRLWPAKCFNHIGAQASGNSCPSDTCAVPLSDDVASCRSCTQDLEPADPVGPASSLLEQAPNEQQAASAHDGPSITRSSSSSAPCVHPIDENFEENPYQSTPTDVSNPTSSSPITTDTTLTRHSQPAPNPPKMTTTPAQESPTESKAPNATGSRPRPRGIGVGGGGSGRAPSGGLIRLPSLASLESLQVMHSVEVTDADLRAVLGPMGRLGYMRNRRNYRLACYFWPATKPANGTRDLAGIVDAAIGGGRDIAPNAAAAPSTARSAFTEFAANGSGINEAAVQAYHLAPAAPPEVAAPTQAATTPAAPATEAAAAAPPTTHQEAAQVHATASGADGTSLRNTAAEPLRRVGSRAAASRRSSLDRTRSVAAACLLSHAFSVASQLSMDFDRELNLDLNPEARRDPSEIQEALQRQCELAVAAAAAGGGPSGGSGGAGGMETAAAVASDGEGPMGRQSPPSQQQTQHNPHQATPGDGGGDGGVHPEVATWLSAASWLTAGWPTGWFGVLGLSSALGLSGGGWGPRRTPPPPQQPSPQSPPPPPSGSDAALQNPISGNMRRVVTPFGAMAAAAGKAESIASDVTGANGDVNASALALSLSVSCSSSSSCVTEMAVAAAATTDGGGRTATISAVECTATETVENEEGSAPAVTLPLDGTTAYGNGGGVGGITTALTAADVAAASEDGVNGSAGGGTETNGCRPVLVAVDRPKGVVVLVHGHGAYLCWDFLRTECPGSPPQYAGSWVEHLNRRGYAVCGIDLQGAGRSEGCRCYIDRFEHYVQDVIDFTAALQRPPPSGGGVAAVVPGFPTDPRVAPRFILGLSLGGGIATHVMHHTGTRLFAGAVLLAPMISLEGMSSRGPHLLLRMVAAALNVLYPHLPIVKGEPNKVFPIIQQLWDADPACFKQGTRVRNALEYLRACRQLAGWLHTLDFPFLVFHSARDKWTDATGSRALYDLSRNPDKTLVAVDHMYHVLTKEDGWREVLAGVVEWLDAHVGAGEGEGDEVGEGHRRREKAGVVDGHGGENGRDAIGSDV